MKVLIFEYFIFYLNVWIFYFLIFFLDVSILELIIHLSYQKKKKNQTFFVRWFYSFKAMEVFYVHSIVLFGSSFLKK